MGVGHSCLQNEHFARDFFQNSLVKSPKQAFRDRLPQKTHTSSLQNERFVRDVLQNSRVMSPKRAFRSRRPPKFTPKRAFRTRFPPKVDGSPIKQHPLSRQSQCHRSNPALSLTVKTPSATTLFVEKNTLKHLVWSRHT